MKLFALTIATLAACSLASANDSFLAKEVGFLLDVVAATDTSGTPVASFLQKMGQQGDKWDVINQSLGSHGADGTYEDSYQIVNDGCGVTGHLANCKIATLVVKVRGKIGAPAKYETSYSEVAGY